MNIGFVSYFAFRPHVEHVYVLSKLVEQAGHRVFSLSCDGSLRTCYKRELTKTSRAVECLRCTAGGLRSYPISNLTSARSYKRKEDSAMHDRDLPPWGHSSACTVHRAETDLEKNSETFKKLKTRLSRSAWQSYQISLRWIEDKQLDAIVCFNGRMEATRGVLEAAKFKNIRFVSVERTWGDGLLLLPESDCLGLRELHRMVLEYKDHPLTENQAYKATRVVASRFLKKNVTEWRAYNLNSMAQEWPLQGAKKKVLILPSSYNEYDGHPDWKMQWSNQFDAFNNVVRHLGLPYDSFVMRGHPNWSETIGATRGEQIEYHYSKWAKENNIHYIHATSNISTQSLIAQADLVILNGGSAALEAGILGKPIISLVETAYKHAGFVTNYLSLNDQSNLDSVFRLDPKTIRIMTIRFLYTWCFRFMQYTREIKALDSLHYAYSKELNAGKLIQIIHSGKVHSDDEEIGTEETHEQEILPLIENNEWERIFSHAGSEQNNPTQITYPRRKLFKAIDKLRSLLPVGDR